MRRGKSASDRFKKNDLSPKAKAVLGAATRLFLKNGYGKTGMDAIAREAGVSKQTVYSNFASKEKLFTAIIAQMCDRFFVPLYDFWDSAEPPAKTLSKFAGHVIDMTLNSSALDLYRLAVAETPRFPELGRTFFASGPEHAVDTLASYFEDLARRKLLNIRDPRAGAQYFFGMLIHYPHLQWLLKKKERPSQREIDRRIDDVVPAFLKLYAVRQSAR